MRAQKKRGKKCRGNLVSQAGGGRGCALGHLSLVVYKLREAIQEWTESKATSAAGSTISDSKASSAAGSTISDSEASSAAGRAAFTVWGF